MAESYFMQHIFQKSNENGIFSNFDVREKYNLISSPPTIHKNAEQPNR